MTMSHTKGEAVLNLPMMHHMTDPIRQLVTAAHKWHKHIYILRQTNPEAKGAFDGWRVLVSVDLLRERERGEGCAIIWSLRDPKTLPFFFVRRRFPSQTHGADQQGNNCRLQKRFVKNLQTHQGVKNKPDIVLDYNRTKN